MQGYPFTKDRIRQEARRDIPPYFRAQVWSCLLDIQGDVARIYETIDKETATSTDRQVSLEIIITMRDKIQLSFLTFNRLRLIFLDVISTMNCSPVLLVMRNSNAFWRLGLSVIRSMCTGKGWTPFVPLSSASISTMKVIIIETCQFEGSNCICISYKCFF